MPVVDTGLLQYTIGGHTGLVQHMYKLWTQTVYQWWTRAYYTKRVVHTGLLLYNMVVDPWGGRKEMSSILADQ
jgi:hypothetical protein